MREFWKNHKYRAIAVYALVVIICCLSFFWLITNHSTVSGYLKKTADVFAPFVYGVIIAYLINPLMKLFERKVLHFKRGSVWERKVRRPLAVFLAFISFGTFLALIIWLIVPQVINSVMEFENQIEGYVLAAQHIVDNFVREFPLFNGEYEDFSEFLNVNELTTDVKQLIANFSNYLEMAINYILKYGSRFVIEVKNILIGIIASVYLLLAKERLVAKGKRAIAAVLNRRQYLNFISLMRYTDKTVGGFLIGKIIDSLIIGILTFIVLSIASMPFTPLISVIVGVTNIIPFFGPFIGAVPSAFIILISEPSKTIWFILIIFVIQQLDGNIIGPKILGSSTGMTSLAVLVAITISGGLFGFSGMIFGVPAAAVICALFQQFTDKRLRAKKMPTDLEFYLNDPPERDYSKQTILLESSEKVEGEEKSQCDVGEE